jgi:small subunit ribosomal protein S1
LLNQSSFISLEVNESISENEIKVEVNINSPTNSIDKNCFLFAALVERKISHVTPNGEKAHYNVFRKMLSGINGEAIDLKKKKKHILLSNIDARWEVEELKSVAWVQNRVTKEVLNSWCNSSGIELVDNQDQINLSSRKAKILRAWESIVDSFKNGTTIQGSVISKTKGGLIVDCNGLETFLPGSQIDIKPVIDYDQYVGKVMEFKVVKINETIKSAVVSHKAFLGKDLTANRKQALSSLKQGQVLEGIVKNITHFGAFINLGGIEGLLYITDISWGRISHPKEVLHLNQRINVVVLDFNEKKKRISVGLKQLTAHPWEVLATDINEGAIVKGKVVNIQNYGAFVEIQPGVEGLVHISEISWGNQSINAKEFFKINQEVEARVVTIDRAGRKMSLSIKQLSADPWSEIEERFPVGSRHEGTVKNIVNYGIFVELSKGVGGMVHISDLSWAKRYAHPSEFTKLGSPLEVVVLDIDKGKRQISLGHKQTQDNPWDNFESMFPVGSYHEATAVKRDDKGVIFSLPYHLEALAPVKHSRKDDNSQVNMGETVTVKVIHFNKEDRRILVSHTKYLDDLKYRAEEMLKAEAQKKVEKGTLGDLSALAQLRDQFSKPNEPAEAQKKVEKDTLGDLSALAQLRDQFSKPDEPAEVQKKVEKGTLGDLSALTRLRDQFLNQEIRDYHTKIKTSTVKQHLVFLKNMGSRFKEIKGSDFDLSILVSMESLLDKIIDDVEDGRHWKEKIDLNLIKTLNDLISLNVALVRRAKKDKDDSVDWLNYLRKYIKILRNL